MSGSRSAVASVGLCLAAIIATVAAAVLPAAVAGAASPPAQGWTTLQAPLPSDKGSNPDVYIASSTCPAANSCVSAGSYEDTSGHYWGLIETQSGTGWAQTEAPEPNGSGTGTAQYAELGSAFCLIALTGCQAVSCPAANQCVTVGMYKDAAGDYYGMIDTLDNGMWTSVQAPEPSDHGTAGTEYSVLQSVSCTSSTSCVAVGRYNNSSGDQEAMIEVLSGTTWTPVTGPVPSGAENGALTQVSCVSSIACVAGGTYTDTSGHQNGLLDTMSGTSWTYTTAPVPSNSGTDTDADLFVFPYDLTCVTSASCAFVGTYEDSAGHQRGLIDTLSGTTWSATEAPQPSDQDTTPSVQLQKVSCPAPTFCVAVGSYRTTSGGLAGLIDTLSGGTWTATVAPQGPSPATGSDASTALMDVDCAAAERCLASGDYETTANGQLALADVLVNGKWADADAPIPSNVLTTSAANGIGRTVACDSSAACIVAGTYSDTSGNTQGYLDTFTGTQGYWLGASDGGIFSFGNAQFYGSTGNIKLNKPIVGMATTPDGQGYWFVGSDGGIFTEGDAAYEGSTGNIKLNKPIVGMAATPDGQGYWLVASDGGIFTEGDAAYEGSTGAITLNKPIVGMAATPDGHGYWLVASDGGIFTEGNAQFLGSTGGTTLNKPIVGMAATPDGRGYWLVASDGGIFSFGDADFYGSTGAITLNKPIVGMAATPDGRGYWLVASDGGIFAFGDADFYGSTGAIALNKPIVGMAT
ncbi:MAG TPA: hypothetical protein VGF87_10295 [Acidimicrobiales bacterium]